MRTRTVIVAAFLGLWLATPALAQTSAWDFSTKTPAPNVAAVPAPRAEPKPAAVVAKKPATPKETTSPKRSPRATPVHAAASPAVRHLSSEPLTVPHGSAPVVSLRGVILDWSAGTVDAAVAPVLTAPPATPVPAPSEPAHGPAATGVVVPPAAAPAVVVPKPIAVLPPAAAATTPVRIQVATVTEPGKPQPTGLERLSNEWPKSVKVGIQYRGRTEEQRGSVITNGRDDAYYLNRIRFETTVTLAPWLKAFAQMQDAQTLGYNVPAQPTSLTNTVDLRQGYVDARWPAVNGIGVRAGRQELAFGDQRLIGSSDWGNTARSFDAVRFSVTQPGVQVDAFMSSVVIIAQNAFDRRKAGETFSGTYVSLSRLLPKAVVEPYILARMQDVATGELGVVGDGATYTFGARVAGALPRRFDYGMEVAAQRGHTAADAVDAWAGHYALGWTIVPSKVKPRLVLEFNNASGDANPKDGRRETFDQLYPTNHNKYGIADQMGWRNMRDAMVGFELFPVKKLKLSADAHRLSLATAADGLYVAGGAQKVLNRKATSRAVGSEIDVYSVYAFSKELSLGAGFSTLVAGDYLSQSTSAGTAWSPYVMWNVKF